jgi:hypothetical protein
VVVCNLCFNNKKQKAFYTLKLKYIVGYSMREIKRLKSVFVIPGLIVFIFSVISIGASVESTNHQASSEVDTNINTDTDDDGLMDTFEYSIEQSISYLFSTRTDPHRKRGEFALFESSNRDMSGEVYRQINFGTPFVYHSLSFLENLPLNSSKLNEITIMKNDAIAFMKQHKEMDNYDNPNVQGVDTGGAVWRYYYGSYIHKKGMGKILGMLYKNDPDIDDTVVILQALYENGENIDEYYPTTATDYFINYQLRDSFIIHKALGPPIRLQYNCFNTWLNGGNQSRFYEVEDYDAVVNANVLFFYSTQLTTLDLQNQIPEVFDYINYALDKMNENRHNAVFPGTSAGAEIVSIYYPSPFTFTYFVSRAYKDGGAPIIGNSSIDINKIKDYIIADDDNDGKLDRQKTDGSWGNFEMIDGTKALVTNDLETALATLTLLNIYDTFNESDKVIAKTAIDKSIEYFLENQNHDGSWDSAFWFLTVPPTMHAGSAEITTGFVLEALAKYQANKSIFDQTFLKGI